MRARVEAGDAHVVVLDDGELVDAELPEDFGEVVLLVAPVTDALKRVSKDMLIEGSVDRDTVMGVEGIVLSATTIGALEDGEMELETLIETLVEGGRLLDVRPAAGLLHGRRSQP